MPPVRLDPLPNVLVDIAAWGVVHSVTGYAVHRLPLRRLQRDGWLLRKRAFEDDGRWYETLRIRRWKDRLPEAGALFTGGVSKRHLPSADEVGLGRFAAETRRAELGHWAAGACGPLFVLWNPPGAAVVMIVYGIVVNAPFIAVQRYNRWRVERIAARTRRSSASPSGDASTRHRF